jgi:hypothetical protein
MVCCIQGSTLIKNAKENIMNRYNATTPRAAAGAAALAATALVIGLSIILPARMSTSAEAPVQAASLAPVVLEAMVIRAERNPELVSAHGKEVPVKPAQQI